MTERQEDAFDVERLVNQIKPIIGGHAPEIQGAVLADLLSLWLAGHRPDLRDELLAAHMRVMPDLVRVSELQIFGPGGFPKGHA